MHRLHLAHRALQTDRQPHRTVVVQPAPRAAAAAQGRCRSHRRYQEEDPEQSCDREPRVAAEEDAGEVGAEEARDQVHSGDHQGARRERGQQGTYCSDAA
eukprot:1439598-Rhodomonas_salina.1